MSGPSVPPASPGPREDPPTSAAHQPVPPAADSEPFLVPNRKAGTGRFWSVRRIPAALLAAMVLGGAGIVLYDIAAVRAGRPAMRWRRTTADALARWRLDDPWVIAVAAAVVVLGLVLLVLAVTPGLRRLLPMRRHDPTVRAGLDRDAAALILRDRAMEVSGVRSVRVRMRRAKVSVRARSHFRDIDEVRADLDAALDAAIAELGLAKPPAPVVRVLGPSDRKG
ncbi:MULTISPECIES: DUF6286 domain-containing protein [Streptomyces]|uniref:DUF6286 domain-containing protein n=1 Tax=Streptomyces TaxID=1883 RepID=UPI001E3E0D5E|nr:DUF6286 domain-containing protein [Streptomyces katsurahamanus]